MHSTSIIRSLTPRLRQIVIWAGGNDEWWEQWRELILPIWSTGVLVWFACMLRFWERKESVLRERWGLTGRGFGSQRLAEFYSNPRIRKWYNERLERFEYYYPFWRKALKFAVTIPVTLLFMLVVLGIGGACLTLEIYLVYQKNGETGEMGVDFGFWTFLVVASPGIIFAILADAICTELLKVVARKMTEWEAHEFRLSFEQSITYKLCAMFMCSVFIYFLAVGLVFVPFGSIFTAIPFMSGIQVEPTAIFAREHCKGVSEAIYSTVRAADDDASAEQPFRLYPERYNLTYSDIENYDQCGRKFRRELFVAGVIDFVFVQQILNVVIKTLLPFVLRRLLCDPLQKLGRDLRNSAHLHSFGKGVHYPHHPDENHEQFHSATDDNCTGVNMDLIVEELGRFEPDSLDDYQEHMSQLAFFAMFPSILPCMPAIFLISNAIDIRADKFKLAYQVKSRDFTTPALTTSLLPSFPPLSPCLPSSDESPLHVRALTFFFICFAISAMVPRHSQFARYVQPLTPTTSILKLL